MTNIPKMLEVSQSTKQRFDEMLLRANVHDSGEARVSASFLLTISEQYAAALHLIANGFPTHAPTLVRSMLDGFASLRNLVEDPNYLDQLKFEDAHSKIVVFDEFSRDPEIQNHQETLAKLVEWKDQCKPIYDALKSKGLRHEQILTTFKKAKISQRGSSRCPRMVNI
jgi:hypothetical protein